MKPIFIAVATLVACTGCVSTHRDDNQGWKTECSGMIDSHTRYSLDRNGDSVRLSAEKDGILVGWFMLSPDDMRANVINFSQLRQTNDAEITIMSDGKKLTFAASSDKYDEHILLIDRDGDCLPDVRVVSSETNATIQKIAYTFTTVRTKAIRYHAGLNTE